MLTTAIPDNGLYLHPMSYAVWQAITTTAGLLAVILLTTSRVTIINTNSVL